MEILVFRKNIQTLLSLQTSPLLFFLIVFKILFPRLDIISQKNTKRDIKRPQNRNINAGARSVNVSFLLLVSLSFIATEDDNENMQSLKYLK